MRKQLAAFLGLFGIWVGAFGQELPKGFVIAEESESPDGRYGVIVPVRGKVEEASGPKNSLVEIKTGRIVAAIEGETSWDYTNHESILPAKWAEDGTLLWWEVEGKWFPHALTLLRLENGKVRWQVDVLKAAQKAILARTKEAAPTEYAAAKKDNEGSGRAYPEGFSVDVAARGAVVLPMKFVVALTSNPKGIEGKRTLESHLEATVDEKGRFMVTNFGLGAGESSHF